MRKLMKERTRKENSTEYSGAANTNPFWYCLQLGFFAGLFWGSLRWLLYTIHFTKVLPGFLAEPFFRQSFLKTFWGHLLGLGFFIVFSILAAFLYKLLLGRFKGPWGGIFYGLLWWLVLFFLGGPVMGMIQPIQQIGYETIFTEWALYLVWGLFIGYTLAYEYNDEASREPMGAH